MNNQERIQVRIARDKIRRQARKEARNKGFDDFHHTIKIQNYVVALNKCKKNVSWKGTVQHYSQNAVCEIDSVVKSLDNGNICRRGN